MPGRIASRVFVVWATCWALVGCQDDYPLPPTLCDRWCAASERAACGNINPSGCVVTCEEQRGDTQRCDDELRTALVCLESLSDAEVCAWVRHGSLDGEFACDEPIQDLFFCSQNWE